MKAKNPLILIASAVLLAAFLSACDRDGPAERAGENIDDAMETTGERMDRAGE